MPKRTKSKGRSTKKTESPQEAPSKSKPNQSSVQKRHIRLFFIVAILISFTFSGVIATRYSENICKGVENNHTPLCYLLKKRSLCGITELFLYVVLLNLCIVFFGTVRVYKTWHLKQKGQSSQEKSKKQFYDVLNEVDGRTEIINYLKRSFFPITFVLCVNLILKGDYVKCWNRMFCVFYIQPLFYIYLRFMAFVYSKLLFISSLISLGVKDATPLLGLLLFLLLSLGYEGLKHLSYNIAVSQVSNVVGSGPNFIGLLTVMRIFFKVMQPNTTTTTGTASNCQTETNWETSYVYLSFINNRLKDWICNNISAIGCFVFLDFPELFHTIFGTIFGYVLQFCYCSETRVYIIHFILHYLIIYPLCKLGILDKSRLHLAKELPKKIHEKVQSSDNWNKYFVKLPFSYCAFAMYVLVCITGVNILFHLAASTVVNDDWYTKVFKVLLLGVTWWNILPVFRLFLDNLMDSWYNFEETSSILLNISHKLHYWVDTGNYTTSTRNNPNVNTMGDTSDDENNYFMAMLTTLIKPELIPTSLVPPVLTTNEEKESEDNKWMKKRIRNVILNVSNGIAFCMTILALFMVVGGGWQKSNLDVLDQTATTLGETTLKDLNTLFVDYGKEDYYKSRPNKIEITTEYNICRHRWHGLTAFDYSLLAAISYINRNNAEQVNEANIFLAKAFPTELYGKVHIVNEFSSELLKSRVDIKKFYNDSIKYKRLIDECLDCTEDKADIFDKFMTVEFEQQKVKVITVQGTDPSAMSDFIADNRLWMESCLFEAAMMLTPTHKFMSPGLVANMVELINSFQRFFVFTTIDLDYYATVTKYAYKIRREIAKSEHPDWKIAVTGHSLGGGIATIVGSTLGIDAIAFSPPGLVRSRKHFDTELPDEKGLPVWKVPRLHLAAKHSINIVPTRDIVAKSDHHFGAVQNTICIEQNPGTCHSIDLAVRDLLTRCGDRGKCKRFIKDTTMCEKLSPTMYHGK